jgi:ketosteroid isomerase-like protein
MNTETKGTVGDVTVRLPEAQVDGTPPKTNRWLVVAVVILAVAVLGLGAALIVGSNDETTPVAGPPVDPAVTTALDGMASALTSGDATATTAFYADNGTLILANGNTFEGTAAISGWMNEAVGMGVQMERVSDVFGNGTFGAALYHYTTSDGSEGYMVRAITLDSAGKIVVEEETERWPNL